MIISYCFGCINATKWKEIGARLFFTAILNPIAHRNYGILRYFAVHVKRKFITMNVQAYLSFSGDCQQALNFYADCFNAKIINKQTYEDAKIDIPASYRHNLQHAELKGKGVHFMAYDAAPDTPLNNGNKIHMAVDLEDRDKAKGLFERLSKGGQVNHHFSEKDWGALYGRCTDKFGIHWMINCDL
jgi:PhnB protein